MEGRENSDVRWVADSNLLEEVLVVVVLICALVLVVLPLEVAETFEKAHELFARDLELVVRC